VGRFVGTGLGMCVLPVQALETGLVWFGLRSLTHALRRVISYTRAGRGKGLVGLESEGVDIMRCAVLFVLYKIIPIPNALFGLQGRS